MDFQDLISALIKNAAHKADRKVSPAMPYKTAFYASAAGSSRSRSGFAFHFIFRICNN